ncbi:Uncharacterised protein [Klebsiella pneumoniae]|nr:Uncharacterised protein [Klebsiella pneumoniae]
MQQPAGLFGIQHQLRLAGDRRAEVLRRLLRRRHAALDRQPGVGPGLPAAVKQAHVFDPGVQHDLRHPRCGVDVATVEDHRGVMPDAVLRQHRFQLCVGHFIPQRFAFHLIGIDIARARDMAQQIEFRRSPGGFEHFPVAGRGGGYAFSLLQVVQPLGVDQLFKVRQLLQAVGLAQRIAQGTEPGEARLFQPRRDAGIIFRVAVQRDGGIRLDLVLLSPGAELIVAHGAEPAGGKIQGLRLMTFGAVGALRPAVVISAQAGVNGHAVLLLQVGESERWHGFSGAGGGSSKPHKQGECGQLRNTFHRNARR